MGACFERPSASSKSKKSPSWTPLASKKRISNCKFATHSLDSPFSMNKKPFLARPPWLRPHSKKGTRQCLLHTHRWLAFGSSKVCKMGQNSFVMAPCHHLIFSYFSYFSYQPTHLIFSYLSYQPTHLIFSYFSYFSFLFFIFFSNK